jgi:hypothetical protein
MGAGTGVGSSGARDCVGCSGAEKVRVGAGTVAGARTARSPVQLRVSGGCRVGVGHRRLAGAGMGA